MHREKEEQAKKQVREEYVSRINRVIDYIEAHIEKNLHLADIARVAHFSPYHFHRIFKAMVGETLNQFIQRIRIEKAASRLIINPKTSITEVALECGFSGSAAFARVFKETFRMSASEWRFGGYRRFSKIRKSKSKESERQSNIGKDFDVSSFYIDNETSNLKWRIKMKNKNHVNVEVKDMPEMVVAYVRHIGPYKGDTKLFEGLFKKIFGWAGPRGLLRFPETKVMAVYHDDPEITDESKLRTDVCISVPKDTPVEGEIGKATIPGGKYAVGHFELKDDGYQEAWNAIFGGWLPESGFQPDERPCFELYLNDPKEHPQGLCIVDICVPVKPL
ncbi:MAG: AraC family transcriptional regulator [Candidatus Aminicenantes bacterium]|nr:AraC family transcriptional regulator [Candidatus Aminicenantes bacterium]